jgi:hypothetical protein
MSSKRKFAALPIIFIFISFVVTIFPSVEAFAAQLQLSWSDNSTNEDGFKIERATGTVGTFAQIGLTGANVTTYNDSNLNAGTTYCYRVRSYNTGGDSPYSNAVCGTTSTGTVNLSIVKSGNGSGTVTSSPAGITCGATCSSSYSTGTTVALTATAASGSTFTGWSGDSDCSDGSVTMDIGKSCTATFQLQTAPGSTLSVNLVNTITSAGTGSGSVTSSPSGISCGADCSEPYLSGASVTLTATPASSSAFSGWSGACGGMGTCAVTMTSNLSVTATFARKSFNLVVDKHGKGKVSSAPLGIDCGASCSGSYPSGSSIMLTPQADPGFSFLGWSGGCSGLGTCTISLGVNTSVTANFSGNIPASIGVFRPGTGEWFLDLNGNGVFDGCGADSCITDFGQQGDLPITGPWNGTQTTLLGVFDPGTAAWYLDSNGNSALDSCELDTCSYVFGKPGDVPVTGDWTGNGQNRIGVYRPSTRQWYFDINGNGTLDTCKRVDLCTKSFGLSGDIPVVGDWTGNGQTKVGVFRPSTGQWYLDLNGDKKVNKRCTNDLCVASFGQPGDLPVVGDWDGSGIDKIGVFRPSTGDWLLDSNGNGIWDGCNVDTCVNFGQQGDLPVVGKW